MITRRTLLQAGLTAGMSAAVPWLPRRALATVSLPPIAPLRLGDSLWLLSGAGGNVVAAAGGSEGLTLVDAGAPGRTAELLKALEGQSGSRHVATVLNTHWHWDHTGGNEVLAHQGARIVAHENTRLWLTEPVISKWESRTYPPLPEHARPTQTFFYGTQTAGAGRGKLEYGLIPQAHTDGDIYVFFPEANVLVAGDVVSGGGYPIADYCTGGWLGGMVTGLKDLLARCDGQTRIIPGSGPVRSKADVAAQLDMCFAVLSKIGDSYFKGQTWDELLAAAPTKGFDARWGNPDVFLKTAYEGAWLHVNEIRRVTR
jgi:glyoxylase-like metal-dependent hydrolase (beta-lactamase superfamily II)